MSFQISGTFTVVFILCMALAVINSVSINNDRSDRLLEIVGLSSLAGAVMSAGFGAVLWIW